MRNICGHIQRVLVLRSLNGAVQLTKNADFDRYKYSEYGIGFDECSIFSFSDGSEFVKA